MGAVELQRGCDGITAVCLPDRNARIANLIRRGMTLLSAQQFQQRSQGFSRCFLRNIVAHTG